MDLDETIKRIGSGEFFELPAYMKNLLSEKHLRDLKEIDRIHNDLQLTQQQLEAPHLTLPESSDEPNDRDKAIIITAEHTKRTAEATENITQNTNKLIHTVRQLSDALETERQLRKRADKLATQISVIAVVVSVVGILIPLFTELIIRSPVMQMDMGEGISVVVFSGALKVIIMALCIGAAFAVTILIPLGIYTIPYALWVGSQNTRGNHLDKKKEKLSRSVKNATTLYRAWLTRSEPDF